MDVDHVNPALRGGRPDDDRPSRPDPPFPVQVRSSSPAAVPFHDEPRPGSMSPRKRRRPSSLPRQPPVAPPLKRHRSNFNPLYVGLFNEQIKDASFPHVPQDHRRPKLHASHVGAVIWTPIEKETLLAAVSRLGQDNLPGIAEAVGTKSIPEIRQYMILLDQTLQVRRQDDSKSSKALRPVDHPAAIEISHELCNALDAAADDLSLRQEAHEDQLEQKKWGEGRWLVSQTGARLLENKLTSRLDGEIAAEPFAELFIIENWLKLPERMFMNSVVEDYNWRSVSNELPSVRTTTFVDFYHLTRSITRRLLATTLMITTGRIRRKKRPTKGVIKVKDVEAALQLVNMKRDSRKFWAGAARRLRLDVIRDGPSEKETDECPSEEQEQEGREPGEAHQDTDQDDSDRKNDEDDEEEDEDDEDDEYEDEDDKEEENRSEANYDIDYTARTEGSEPETLTYYQVEASLGFPNISGSPKLDTEEDDLSSELEDDDEDDLIEVEMVSSGKGEGRDEADMVRLEGPDVEMEDEPRSQEDDLTPLIDIGAVDQDLWEATEYSAIEFAGTTRARDALRSRIVTEHRLEADANRFDENATRVEEERLWKLLHGENHPTSEPDHTALEGLKSFSSRKVGLDGEDMSWRARLTYRSEWEL